MTGRLLAFRRKLRRERKPIETPEQEQQREEYERDRAHDE